MEIRKMFEEIHLTTEETDRWIKFHEDIHRNN
jgi:hypothetical protein